MGSSERRAEPRSEVQSAAYLMWDDSSGPRQAKATLLDISGGGLRLHTSARLAPGTIVYCASPSQQICTRGIVCHSNRSFLQTTAGVRFLASF